MDLLSRSLRLLPERLEQLSRGLAEVKAQLVELQRGAGKADVTEVTKLKEQLGRVTSTMVKKIEVAETEHFNHFNSQLQALNAVAALKAESGEVARLDKELQRLSECSARMAGKLEEVEARHRELGPGKAALEGLEQGLARQLEALRSAQEGLEGKQAEQQQHFRELAAATAAEKLNCAVLEQLNSQYRTLSTGMSQKVDWADMEQMKHQVSVLSQTVAGKAESSLAELLAPQYRAMWAATRRLEAAAGGTEVEGAAQRLEHDASVKGVPPLDKPFAACVDQISQQLEALGRRVEQKAEKARLEQLFEQFQVLVDLLTPKLTPCKPQPKRPQSARPRCGGAPRPGPSSHSSSTSGG